LRRSAVALGGMAGLGLLDPSSVFASATAAPRPIPGGLSLQNGFVPSALGLSPTPVPPVPSHVSFDVRWPGHGERQKIRDETFGFTGAYVTSATTISFTAFNDHSDVIYKSDRKGQYNPTVEQGGAGLPAVDGGHLERAVAPGRLSSTCATCQRKRLGWAVSCRACPACVSRQGRCQTYVLS